MTNESDLTVRETSGGTDSSQTHSTDAPGPSLESLIAAQPFFKGMSVEQHKKLAESALLMEFKPEEWIVREGEAANRFYIILEGSVIVETENENGGGLAIQTLGPGDDLGWSWLFLPYYVHLSARAASPVRAIFFYGTRLRKQCEEDHDLGYEIMRRIAEVVVQRLEHLRSRILQMSPAELRTSSTPLDRQL